MRAARILSTSGPAVERHIGDHLHQTLEQVVARDEIGLGIDLDDDAFVGAHADADQTFGRDPTGLLGGLGQALFAQPVDRGFEIAAGLAERGLAVHHAGSGLIAELFHHACGDVCHRCMILDLNVIPGPSEARSPESIITGLEYRYEPGNQTDRGYGFRVRALCRAPE